MIGGEFESDFLISDASYRKNRRHLYTITTEGDKKQFSCNSCSAVFNSYNPMSRHLSTAHVQKFESTGNTLEEDKTYTCDTCKKEITGHRQYMAHVRHHKPHVCQQCSATFTHRRKLKFHCHEVHGAEIPTCGICGYKNICQTSVLEHQRNVHMKEKNVSCPHCDAKFFGPLQLNKHLVRHNPIKIFECTYCKKRFPRQNTLAMHLKIHTGVKNKVCPICDERFVQRASLSYHMTKRHPEAV